ncbi:GGDEF domain-containing protein, partial [Myxococcota bacterium]|nr:GGDEF domain-containing protein [Myxococcota bacterium]
TRRMQTANTALERTLEASRAEIATLQRDLDDVRREALLDPLTKVHNRKAFDDGLLRAVAHAAESGRPLCLMLIDIDHFKRFNDTRGHLAGDEVIRGVADALREAVRAVDCVFRYGGEEFLILLPETVAMGARLVAERVRAAVARRALPHPSSPTAPHVTVSLGYTEVATGEQARQFSWEDVVQRADEALYTAKQQGRNRACAWIGGK